MYDDSSAVGIILIVVLVMISLGIAIWIFSILYSALDRVPAEYRQMEPGQVFLVFIPLFGMIWLFFIVSRVSGSYQQFFAAKGANQGDCSYGVGLGWAICSVCGIIPYLGVLASLASLVLMIIYLVQVSGYKNTVFAIEEQELATQL